TAISTLSLHDALPILPSPRGDEPDPPPGWGAAGRRRHRGQPRTRRHRARPRASHHPGGPRPWHRPRVPSPARPRPRRSPPGPRLRPAVRPDSWQLLQETGKLAVREPGVVVPDVGPRPTGARHFIEGELGRDDRLRIIRPAGQDTAPGVDDQGTAGEDHAALDADAVRQDHVDAVDLRGHPGHTLPGVCAREAAAGLRAGPDAPSRARGLDDQQVDPPCGEEVDERRVPEVLTDEEPGTPAAAELVGGERVAAAEEAAFVEHAVR